MRTAGLLLLLTSLFRCAMLVTSDVDQLLSGIKKGSCLDYRKAGEYWSFRWCHERNVSPPSPGCATSLSLLRLVTGWLAGWLAG